MNVFEEDRGVSTIVGAVLLFAIIIILMSIWQAQGVPAHNSQVEYDHFITSSNDLSNLRAAQIDAASTESIQSSPLTLGTRYPERVVFVNPPPPEGTVSTTIHNNGTYYVNGNPVSTVCDYGSSVKGKAITYSANYNYYSNQEIPAFILENSVLYQDVPNSGVIPKSNQALVSGNTVSLYLVTTNLSESGHTATSLDVHANTSLRYLTVNNISIPTGLSAEEWNTKLPANANAVERPGDRVQINIAGASRLRCTALGINQPPTVTSSPAQKQGGGGGDTLGPTVTNVSPSSNTVPRGTTFDLRATIDDTGRGGTDIIEAEWYSNRSNPNGVAGAGYQLGPSDGEFDQSVETVENTSIDTSNWSEGWHTLSVRGKDANLTWGPENYANVKITTGVAFGLNYTWYQSKKGGGCEYADTEAEMDAHFQKGGPGGCAVGSQHTGTHTTKVSWSTGPQYGNKPTYITEAENYAWKADGYVYAGETGTYTIGVDSDDASDVFIDGTKVVSWYGAHAMDGSYSAHQGTVTLSKGWHPITIRMQEHTGEDGVSVGWKPPGETTFEPIPSDKFSTTNP